MIYISTFLAVTPFPIPSVVSVMSAPPTSPLHPARGYDAVKRIETAPHGADATVKLPHKANFNRFAVS